MTDLDKLAALVREALAGAASKKEPSESFLKSLEMIIFAHDHPVVCKVRRLDAANHLIVNNLTANRIRLDGLDEKVRNIEQGRVP